LRNKLAQQFRPLHRHSWWQAIKLGLQRALLRIAL
jgi:hypothetical protein